MKRLLIVIFLLFIVSGGMYLWFLSRDSSEKIINDGIKSLIQAKSVSQFSMEAAKTDLQTGITTGFSFLGQLSAPDVTKPAALGVIRIGAKTTTESDQLIDAVLSEKNVMLRPRNVSADNRRIYFDFSSDATGATFIAIGRDVFLNKVNYQNAISKGKSENIRSAFNFVLPVIIIDNEISYKLGKSYPIVKFRLDKAGLRAFLIEVVKAWIAGEPRAEHFVWIDKVADEFGSGNFEMVLNNATREPMRLIGTWPEYDADGREIARIKITIELNGINQEIKINEPENYKNITDLIYKKDEPIFLPKSSFKEGVTTTTPITIVPSNQVLESGIDYFSKYSEALKKKKDF